MATLRDYFTSDFGRWMSVSKDYIATVTPSMENITFPVRVHEDMAANAKFVSVYVPEAIHPIGVAKMLADDIGATLKIGTSTYVEMAFGNLRSQERNTDLKFTGRFIVFAEREIPSEEIEQFREYCRSKDLMLVWRDSKYAAERSRLERPMAFISHDSRDKKEVAEPIASGLQLLVCPVWYDEYSLGVGDSLRESIEKGIKESHKCIIVLSPSFFANGGWTKAEFDSIYTREIVEQQNVMLPIWHNVSRIDVYNYCPRLADRVGLNTSLGMKEIVRRLYAKLSPT